MAKFCTECGATLSDDKKFCTECGTPVQAEPQENMVAELVTDEQPAETAPVYTEPVNQPVYQQAVQTPPPVQPTYQQAAQTPPPVQPVYQQTVQAPPPVMPIQQTPPPVYGADVPPAKGSKYDPITTGGYIGIMLLMCIPVVGLILILVWAFGGCKKINKRNLARATLIMAAISLVISLILGLLIKSLFGAAVSQIEKETGLSGLSGLITGEESVEDNASGNDDSSGLSSITGLLGGISALGGDGDNSNVTNQDIQELEELSDLLGALEGISGEGSTNGLDELVDNVTEINKEAEAAGTGWPKELRPYPGGTQTEVASYRTEITGTSHEEMWDYINDLKSDGYKFQDFYDMGISEEDMADYGWWGTDGTVYVSLSYYEGTVTIDHMYELPDLSSLMGG